MKRQPLCLLIAALIAPAPAMSGNCGVGVGAGVGNPHCSGGPRVPLTNHAGVQPAKDAKPPSQLGHIVPDHHNTALAPVVVTGTLATVSGYAPVPTPTAPATITGNAPVPPQPLPQQTPMLVPTPTPPRVLPPQQTPKLVVPPGFTPDQALVRPIVVTGTQTTVGGQAMEVRGVQTTVTGYAPVPPGPQATGTQTTIGGQAMQVPGVQTTVTGYAPVPPQQQVTGTQTTIAGQAMQVPGVQTTVTGYAPVPAQQQVTGTQTTVGGQAMEVRGVQTTVTGYAPVPPQPQVTGTQTASAAGSAAQVPSSAHQNALLVHAPNTPQPVTSGAHPVDGIYSFEFIEPGLQHRKVKVYRTRDAAEEVYKDTIPLDQGGFQVIVIGTRNPAYVH